MEQQVNLYQPILRAEKRLFSAAAIGAGLLVLVASLAAMSAYTAWQARRAEATVAALEQQEAARLLLMERAGNATGGIDESALQSELVVLANAIAARERALAAVGASAATAGFAVGLEALGRPPMDGLWLRRIVIDPARGGLALQGATRDPELVPAYLRALRGEQALAGATFDRFELRRAGPDEEPAAVVFTVAAPGVVAALSTDPFDGDGVDDGRSR